MWSVKSNCNKHYIVHYRFSLSVTVAEFVCCFKNYVSHIAISHSSNLGLINVKFKDLYLAVNPY